MKFSRIYIFLDTKYCFSLAAAGSSYLPSVERSALPYDSSVRGPRKSLIFGESGGIERFQLASEFCALQLPNASGMLLIYVVLVVDLSTPLSLERVDSSGICLSCVQLMIPSGKRNVGARRCCLSCRSYKLSFCALQLPNAKSLLS